MSSATATAAVRQIDIRQLRTGLYVHLDLGWLDHPFPTNRFMLRSDEQLQKLRDLGLRNIGILPDRCEPAALAALDPLTADGSAAPALGTAKATGTATAVTDQVAAAALAAVESAVAALSPAEAVRTRHRELLQSQQANLQHCQKLHSKAVEGWQMVMREAAQDPALAAEATQGLARQFVSELNAAEDTTIRVLSEAAGTGQSQHAVNVTVLSLMLGQKMGLSADELQSLTTGALMHDIGKLLLPEALRNLSFDGSANALKARRDHVSHGVRMGMSMGLDPLALRVIAQHHELVDGSGLPQGLKGAEITLPARIVALADIYDNLCNPASSAAGSTPHEAQALLYAQMRQQVDANVLSTFIKMIGVYPPGSVVQLTDERYALVVNTHPHHPLKPCVLVHDAKVPREEALLLDLQRATKLGVRRSLHPQHLPRATMDYLSPGKRVHYYFSQSLEAAGGDMVA